MYKDYTTESEHCQAFSDILDDIKLHKAYQLKLAPSLSEAYRRTKHWSTDKDTRLRACGDFVMISTSGKIIGANFCKNRYCPFCQWRLSRRIFGQAFRIVDYIKTESPDNEFLFLTVTLKNTPTLSDGLTSIMKGFNNLTHDRTFRRVAKGFMRSLEITYNEDFKTWHPHIHCVLSVGGEYFKSDYLSHEKWLNLWNRAARVTYSAGLYIEKVHGDITSQVAEISKYAVKPSSLSVDEVSDIEVYSDLISCTYNRRLRSYGGNFKKAMRALGINLIDDYTEYYEREKEGCNYLIFNKKEGAYRKYDDLRSWEKECK